jgi:osmotically-inducible protein OsmY
MTSHFPTRSLHPQRGTMKDPFRLLCITSLIATLVVSAWGCAPVVVGGAAVGASVIHDRRSSATVLEDQNIELSAYGKISDDETLSGKSRISVTSYNRVVLLTGQADSPAVKARVARLVSDLPEVRRVVDEVTVAPRASLQRESTDAYLTSRVKLALFDLGIEGFDPTRVKVVTEEGVVFLMGLLTDQEAAAVVEKVRYVDGVERVVKIFEYVEPES